MTYMLALINNMFKMYIKNRNDEKNITYMSVQIHDIMYVMYKKNKNKRKNIPYMTAPVDNNMHIMYIKKIEIIKRKT
jgi:hypothetical protein